MGANAGSFRLDSGFGYASSSSPTLLTFDTLDRALEKAVGEDFSGFHATVSIATPLTGRISLLASLSGASESGSMGHPKTFWRRRASLNDSILEFAGGLVNASWESYSLLAGLRI